MEVKDRKLDRSAAGGDRRRETEASKTWRKARREKMEWKAKKKEQVMK